MKKIMISDETYERLLNLAPAKFFGSYIDALIDNAEPLVDYEQVRKIIREELQIPNTPKAAECKHEYEIAHKTVDSSFLQVFLFCKHCGDSIEHNYGRIYK